MAFHYLKGAFERAAEGLYTRACRGGKRGNAFTLKETRFRRDTRMKFFIPSLEGHAGWGSEQLGVVEGVPAHDRGKVIQYWSVLHTTIFPSDGNPVPGNCCEMVLNNIRAWPHLRPGYCEKLTLPWLKLGQWLKSDDKAFTIYDFLWHDFCRCLLS